MRTNLVEFMGRAFVPFVVMLAFALFQKLLPASRNGHRLSQEKLWELDDRFSPFRARIICGMIVIAIFLFFGVWKALIALNSFVASLDGPATIRLLPQTAIWWFFPLFGALSLCWELTLQICALFWDRQTADLFSDWTNQSSSFWGRAPGYDSRRVLRWLFLLVALPIGVFTTLALSLHVSLGPDTIRDYGYAFKPCTTYSLDQANRLTQIEGFRTRDGRVTRRAGIVVDFKDGRRWSSADWGNFEKTIDPTLVELLMSKTGLPLNFAITEAEIPSLRSQLSPEPH
jgi:hypothetical protein